MRNTRVMQKLPSDFSSECNPASNNLTLEANCQIIFHMNKQTSKALQDKLRGTVSGQSPKGLGYRPPLSCGSVTRRIGLNMTFPRSGTTPFASFSRKEQNYTLVFS